MRSSEINLRIPLDMKFLDFFELMDRKWRMTCFVLPPVAMILSEAVRERSMHHLACVATRIALYEIEKGTFPKQLSDLTELGTDLDRYKPIGTKPFGYRVIAKLADSDRSEGVLLWGPVFKSVPSKGLSTEDEPPSLENEQDRGWNSESVWTIAK
jgi:hypothetical protein